MKEKPENKFIVRNDGKDYFLKTIVYYYRMCGDCIAEPDPARKIPKGTDEQEGTAVHRLSKEITPTDKGCRRRKKK